MRSVLIRLPRAATSFCDPRGVCAGCRRRPSKSNASISGGGSRLWLVLKNAFPFHHFLFSFPVLPAVLRQTPQPRGLGILVSGLLDEGR